MHLLDQNFCENNVCLTKFRSKHSSNTVLCLLRNLMHQTLLCLESGLSKRTLLGRRVTLLGQVQYFKVAPSIHETSLNLGFNFSPNFMWAHGFQSN